MKESVYGQTLAFDQFFNNRVVCGMIPGTATTASTQVTGTGASAFQIDFKIIQGAGSSSGIVIVGGKVKEFASAGAGITQDFILASTAAQQFASLYEAVYAVFAYRNVISDAITLGVLRGTPALTTVGAVAPTNAQIEAVLAAGTSYLRLTDVLVKRTADTTVALTYDNTVRNLQRPATVQNP